jgi:hypothetical protein
MLGLARSSGVRAKSGLEVSPPSPEVPARAGPRMRLDTMPYHDAEEAAAKRPSVFTDLESEEDESNRDTLPNFTA